MDFKGQYARLAAFLLIAGSTAGTAPASGGNGLPEAGDRRAAIHVCTDRITGPIKAVNGGNLAPPLMDEEMPGCDVREAFAQMHIPITRLHDAPLENAGMRLVDLPMIFGNFKADASDPGNYYFDQTDDYIRGCVESGTQVYYRLGTSIEHNRNKYFTHPPEDVKKWIDVASNVIRHYNEGKWNGFHYGIEYWEIWNEPDLGPKMWTGTLEQFNDFYAQAARELKKRFPNLKFGGPGHCAFSEQRVKEFAENCARHKAPLDFYSFHYYSPTDTELLQMAVDARRWLDECGYPDTEVHLNEWHYNPYGGALWNMGPAEQNEAIRFMRGLESAAFLNTVMIGWQDVPLDKGFYYTVTTTRWGVFEDRTPTKTYYGMRAFGELTRYGERVLLTANDLPAGSRSLAGRNGAGDLAILTACWKSGPREIVFDIDGIERFGPVEVYLLDETHDLERVCALTAAAGPLTVHTVSDSSVILIKLKKKQ